MYIKGLVVELVVKSGERRGVVKMLSVKEELLVLRQWLRREALEFCYCSAETEWRSSRILLLEKLLESFVRSQVDYK